MPSRRRRKPSAAAEAVTFWAVVLVIASIVAFISYRVGKDWLGKRLGSVEMNQGAPRIVAEADLDAENAARLEQEANAPKKAEVSTEDREPTPAEKLRAERAETEEEPQDGAQLNEADPESDEPPEEATDPPSDTGASGGGFTVTAGSFSDRENASRMVARLAAQGYKPYVVEVSTDGKTLHRVNVAAVKGRDKAERLRDELAGTGVDAGIIAGG